ncbi:MAG: hypothetical protein ACHQNE_05500 [Candidatus Kapaibacterium sp.]
MMTYEQLVDELHARTADELVDLARIARHFAREYRRDEIRRNIEESRRQYLAGELDPPTDNIEELMARVKDVK